MRLLLDELMLDEIEVERRNEFFESLASSGTADSQTTDRRKASLAAWMFRPIQGPSMLMEKLSKMLWQWSKVTSTVVTADGSQMDPSTSDEIGGKWSHCSESSHPGPGFAVAGIFDVAPPVPASRHCRIADSPRCTLRWHEPMKRRSVSTGASVSAKSRRETSEEE